MKDINPKENECISGQSEEIKAKSLEKPAVSYDTFDKFAQEIRKKFESLKSDTQKMRKEFNDEITRQVQIDRASLITVFGIFASMISFLTIEFQFLKTLSGVLEILGFSLVLFSLLFGFNIALDYLVKSRLDKEVPKPNMYFCGFVGVLFILGVIAIWLGHIHFCQ